MAVCPVLLKKAFIAFIFDCLFDAKNAIFLSKNVKTIFSGNSHFEQKSASRGKNNGFQKGKGAKFMLFNMFFHPIILPYAT